MRKIATQIPQTVSQLIEHKTINPPVWFLPSLSHPPIPLPPRQLSPSAYNRLSSPFNSSSSSSSSSKSQPTLSSSIRKQKHLRTIKPRPQTIVLPEDIIRRRFFSDFPFEALRPTSLVEGKSVGDKEAISGKEWISLSMRGDCPTVEDTIAYTLSLHTHHSLSLSDAYLQSTKEFIHLREIYEIARFAAEEETEYRGWRGEGFGGLNGFKRFQNLEKQSLKTLAPPSSTPTTDNSSQNNYRSHISILKRQTWSPRYKFGSSSSTSNSSSAFTPASTSIGNSISREYGVAEPNAVTGSGVSYRKETFLGGVGYMNAAFGGLKKKDGEEVVKQE